MKRTLRCHDFGEDMPGRVYSSEAAAAASRPKSRQPARGCGQNRR